MTTSPGLQAKTVSQHVTAEIRAEIARQNTSSRQLATKLGVNHQWVTRRVNSLQVDLAPEDIELLASGLGVPVWRFLPREWLPRLDSNQQPAGYKPGLAALPRLGDGAHERSQRDRGHLQLLRPTR